MEHGIGVVENIFRRDTFGQTVRLGLRQVQFLRQRFQECRIEIRAAFGIEYKFARVGIEVERK